MKKYKIKHFESTNTRLCFKTVLRFIFTGAFGVIVLTHNNVVAKEPHNLNGLEHNELNFEKAPFAKL